MYVDPFFRPGRDRFVDAQEVRVRGHQIKMENAGCIAGPDHGAGVMGDGHAFKDHP
jgi:hypothetical protein